MDSPDCLLLLVSIVRLSLFSFSVFTLVDFGKLFTETNEQKFSLGGVQS